MSRYGEETDAEITALLCRISGQLGMKESAAFLEKCAADNRSADLFIGRKIETKIISELAKEALRTLGE